MFLITYNVRLILGKESVAVKLNGRLFRMMTRENEKVRETVLERPVNVSCPDNQWC